MKYVNSKMATLTVLALTALLWAAPARGQSHYVRFDIPFQFVAADEVLPAGQYEVRLDQFARVILQQSGHTTAHVVPLAAKYVTRPSGGMQMAALRFNRHNGTAFLTAVWAPGKEDGRVVTRSERAIEAMRTGGAAGESVTLNSDLK